MPPPAQTAPMRDEPVGTGEYVLQSGDCIHSVADAAGLFWKTLWNHGDNSAVRDARSSPAALLPGDMLHVPEIELKRESRGTGARHKFRRKGVPVQVVVQVLEPVPSEDTAGATAPEPQSGDDTEVTEGEEASVRDMRPAKNLKYVCTIDGRIENGSTDGDGKVTLDVMPGERYADLKLEPGTLRERTLRLDLGGLDPHDSTSGAMQRLANLGYAPGAGQQADRLRVALEGFQVDQGMTVTGTLDAETVDKLKEVHQS